MTKWNRIFLAAVFAMAAVIATLTGASVRAQDRQSIHVSSVDDLYTAVNDPGHAGARIVIAPGTYFLDPTKSSGGRLEFQRDMTIVGQRGDADAVVIDASDLPASSYALGGTFMTGAVRMGRGSNSLEWLTIQRAVNGIAAVETDLPAGPDPTVVRVAHTVVQGNHRGIDIRHLGPGFNGHVLQAILQENVVRDNTLAGGFGIRVIDAQDVSDATIRATLRGNQAYGNIVGCLVVNSDSSHSTLLVDSRADRFTHNSVGLGLLGGSSLGNNQANSNVVIFQAHADAVEQNDVPLDPSLLCQSHQVPGCSPTGGGISVEGAFTNRAVPDQASANFVHLALVDTSLSGNQDADIHAWGAFSASDVFPGTHNHVAISLKRITDTAVISTVDSEPPDPNGTNTVVVFHDGRH